MVKEFTSQELFILVNGVDDLQTHEFIELMECFPFQNLVNISLLNCESMRLHLQFLIKLSKKDLFYKHSQAVKCCLEFALTNLSSLDNVCITDLLTDLIRLLKHILSKVKVIKEYVHDIAKDRERMFDIIVLITKLKIFERHHISDCTDVLYNLLTMGGPLPLTTSRSLAEISEIFKGFKAVRELAIISSIVLKKFTPSTEVFNVCIPWLMIYGPSFLREQNEDDETMLELLKSMNEFYTKHGCSKNKRKSFKNDLLEAFEESILHLRSITNEIILMSRKENIREAGLRLVSFLLFEDRGENLCVKEMETVILNGLLGLPVDVTQWSRVGSNMFFHVCSFLVTYSSLIWSPQEILSAISSLIYSYDRFSISLDLLKTLCYLYPILMVDYLNKTTLLLGDELLIILSKFPCTFHKIFTPHVAQLVWILKQGDCDLKIRILCQWLKRDDGEMDMLGKAILQCNVAASLLDIILDQTVDEVVRDRAMEMSHRIQDDTLSKNIAMHIPVVLNHEALLYRLILSNPGTPDNTEHAFKICEFMSHVLFAILDEKVFKAACIYCKRLLTDLKRDNRVVPLFCQEIDNIRFLALKVNYVDDETAAEIVGLLKVLILIQKRNHNIVEEIVEVDLSKSFVGLQIKVEKCLNLVQIIVTSKDVIIKLDEVTIRNTFLNLFSLSMMPQLSVRTFICLTGILRKYGWLASVHSTCLFVEIQCSLKVDASSGPEFMMFLSTWMKILKCNPHLEIPYVPNKKTISNYVERVDFLSETKVTYLLQTLNKLMIFADVSSNRLRYFNQLCLQ